MNEYEALSDSDSLPTHAKNQFNQVRMPGSVETVDREMNVRRVRRALIVDGTAIQDVVAVLLYQAV